MVGKGPQCDFLGSWGSKIGFFSCHVGDAYEAGRRWDISQLVGYGLESVQDFGLGCV